MHGLRFPRKSNGVGSPCRSSQLDRADKLRAFLAGRFSQREQLD